MTTTVKQERSAPLKIQFNQGHYAFSRGWISNQYPADSIAGKEWQRGWNAAYFQNLDRIKR